MEKLNTFTITYVLISTVSGSDRIHKGYARFATPESLQEIVTRITTQGFHVKNAGNDHWVLPSALLTIAETDERGYPLKTSKMSCNFCDRGIKLLPGFTGAEQYHEFQSDVDGYPKCAYPFLDRGANHPFLPSLIDQSCDFCGQPKDNEVHKL